MKHVMSDAERTSVLPASQDPRHRNRNLQWLRALAALFVLLYHASVYLSQILGDDTFLRVFDGRFGLLGVAVFFAISGYLMAEILPRVDPWRFLLHRVVRIYPIFFVVLGSLLLVRRKFDEIDLWAITLVPVGEGRVYYLGVEWTLLFETTFYVFLFVCSLLGLRNRLPAIAVLWLLIVAAATVLLPGIHGSLTPHIELLPLVAVNVAFALGLLIPVLRDRGFFQPTFGTLAVGLVLLCNAWSFAIDRWLASVAAFFLVGMVVSNVPSASRGRNPVAWLADRYGDWSYALYLCHAPLVVVVYLKHPPFPNWMLWALAVSIPLAVAIPYGSLDLALYRITKRWVDTTAEAARVSFACAYAFFFVGVAATASLVGTGANPPDAPQPIVQPVPPPAETGVPTLVPDPAAPSELAPARDLP